MNNTRQEIEEILKQVEENVRSDINGVGGNYDEELEELTKREADIRQEVQAEKEQYLKELKSIIKDRLGFLESITAVENIRERRELENIINKLEQFKKESA